MSKVDADRALAIYKTFSRQTEEVVRYLSTARQYEHATRLEIPKLKHAPTSLTASLEEYVNDPDFDINRRQYIAQQEAKRTGKPVKDVRQERSNGAGRSNSANGAASSAQASAPAAPKGPAPDMIDFFESIEQNQQPMNAYPQNQAQQFPYQQQGFPQANNQFVQQGQANLTNPFAQMIPQQTVAQTQVAQNFNQQPFPPQQQTQFNPHQLSSIPQDQLASFQPQFQQTAFSPNGQQQPFPQQQQQQQQQLTGSPTGSTNPFRQSMMPTGATSNGSPFTSPAPTPQSALQRQSTNPFARSIGSQNSSQQDQTSPFQSAPPIASNAFFPIQSPSPQTMSSPQPTGPMAPQRTGTNPFARSAPASTFQTPSQSPLVAQATGTNPFRQSAFINQATGQGWQAGQGTMGGLENMQTMPIFPRPAQQPAPFQTGQAQGSPWS